MHKLLLQWFYTMVSEMSSGDRLKINACFGKTNCCQIPWMTPVPLVISVSLIYLCLFIAWYISTTGSAIHVVIKDFLVWVQLYCISMLISSGIRPDY